MTLLVMSGCSGKSTGDTTTGNNVETSTDIVGTVGCNKDNKNKKDVPDKIENPDFRNVQWGMSKNEVKEYEELELNEDPEDSAMLCAITKVNEYSMILVYAFNSNDELYSAYYLLSEDYTSENRYIIAYDTLLEALTEKYGDPISEENIWVNDLFSDSPNDYGFAVSRGDYVRKSAWIEPGTNIQMCLTGENYNIVLGIKYSSENFTGDIDNSL